ncbi:hypothetical protein SAPIO_CDS4454 [Scedosporium apiospermum]|uniref:chitinase n=1 Tax=Pseudallescheria apiosperma TaxID=563466 RepID=A0A084G880_PSEDA|nr:uncharacterized protein SAPIO_CDS4454 [Scedosporium apiospermum]KEZ43542.1 hypothetical protein SAPIO_CDS4454 [Scedosporium apiospermum]
MTGVKRVISFGGWTDSTSGGRSFILRGAISTGREQFARNVVDFIIQHDLDGLDIDWEYPGAKDIDGIVPDASDGENYLETLKLIRSMLPSGKTLAIATPASFWYLQGFPIAEMATYLDYIVYMTYDLHGQWDWGKKYGQISCPTGDCLLSHVNYTETENALSMITKAGVPSNKIIVGVTSYGRSFRMVEPGCTGPECKYMGPESGAKKGLCTGTPGYLSDAEINQIIQDGTSTPWKVEGEDAASSLRRREGVQVFYDHKSQSNVLVYDDVEWVAYMNRSNKEARKSAYQALNFGGITDWAVDLQEFSPNEYITPFVMKQLAEGEECKWRWLEGVDCLNEGIRNASSPKKWQWHEAATDCAWRFVKTEWSKQKGNESGEVFSLFVSKKLNGPRNFNCQEMSINGCSGSTPLCTVFQTIESGPAAMFIISSFMKLHEILLTFYDGVGSAALSFITDIDEFMAVFSPDPPEQRNDMNIFIDILGIAFTFLGVGVFKTLGTEGNKKDLMWNLLALGGSLIKDIPSNDKKIDRKAIISIGLHYLQDGLKDGVSEFSLYLLSGRAEALPVLDNLLSDGKFITGEESSAEDWSKKTMENNNMRLLYAWLIPSAWSLAQRSPVVIEAGDCSRGTGEYEWITSSTAEETGGCIDGRQYFLVTTAVEWESETPNCFCASPLHGRTTTMLDTGEQ